MKAFAFLGLVLLASIAAGCDSTLTQPPAGDSWIQVYVHWNDEGLAGREIQIVERGLVAYSDSSGHATFELPAGTYTVRAYVTGPGPAGFHDYPVTTEAGTTTPVDVFDCILCQ